MNHHPLVSAVIPTRYRPALVRRAVQSALLQTYTNLEVIVVIDGPDQNTIDALAQIQDERLKVVALSVNVGGAEARNTGVRLAKGEWIAFLDDDDEWLPDKIDKQTATSLSLENRNTIISCRYLARTETSDQVCPGRLPAKGERIDEYICCPRGYRQGEGFLQTSTYFVPRELMIRVPFVLGLKRGQDFVWMVQACTIGQAELYVHPEVLSIFTAGGGAADPSRISSNPKWRSLYDWIRTNRGLFTRRTYAYCLTTIVLPDVMLCHEGLGVRLSLAADAFLRGSPRPKSLFLFILRAFFPPSIIRLVKRMREQDTTRSSGAGVRI